MKRIIPILLLTAIILPLYLSGCYYNNCNCTEIFEMQMITVAYQSGAPVIDAVVDVQWKDTGQPIDESGCDNPSEGQYCILTDNEVSELTTIGREVTVTVSVPEYQPIKRDFTFTTDDCQCHINLVSGDTMFIVE